MSDLCDTAIWSCQLGWRVWRLLFVNADMKIWFTTAQSKYLHTINPCGTGPQTNQCLL
jgi:hypothetical protein